MKLMKKGLVLGALLMASCIGMASLGYAEAKAYEAEALLKGSYRHTMTDEFFIRTANLYNAYNPACSWGEVLARTESGYDGSVVKAWMIGDLKRDADNNFVLKVKRHVIQKLDSQGNIHMNKIDDVSYDIKLLHRMESGVKLESKNKAKDPYMDVNGEYVTAKEYPSMSSEAAIYVLERFMNSNPNYRQKLLGAGIEHFGAPVGDVHTLKIVEQHPTHVVTRGTYEVSAAGTILEYDVVMDKWNILVD